MVKYSNESEIILGNSLLKVLRYRDNYTFEHTFRVEAYSDGIVTSLGLDVTQRRIVREAAKFHDIGKIAIPGSWTDSNKTLTKLETYLIRTHPIIGYLIIRSIGYLQPTPWSSRRSLFHDIALGVRHHHENIDGGGYPDGLKSDEIPLTSRIISVADYYDSLRTRKDHLSHENALERLNSVAGTILDPLIIDVVLKNSHLLRNTLYV